MNSPLPETTHISFLQLRVSDMPKALAFYQGALGFERVSGEQSTLGLAASQGGKPFLFLSEDKTATPALRRAPGLFHVAYLYPSRKELAKAFKRLYEHRWPFQGFADHGVSEALYLADPEGNGIELYADRPRAEWLYQDGQLQMTTDHLDVENLLSEVSGNSDSESVIHPQTRIGHIHLQVSDLSKAEKFYHELVGLDVTLRNYPGALFVSAGGYHHHIGFNIWNSRGTTRPAGQTLGLEKFRIELPGEKAFYDLKKRLEEAGNVIEDGRGTFAARDLDSLQIEFSLS